MNKGFSGSIYLPNPVIGEGMVKKSCYIFNQDGLKDIKNIDPLYASYFIEIKSNLTSLVNSTQNESLANWVNSLHTKTKVLEIHDNDSFNVSFRQFSNYYIQYSNSKVFSEWKKNHGKLSIELLNIDLSFLPKSLIEVYNIGVIWLHGIPSSGYFYHPNDIKRALEEEYLKDYIAGCDEYPLDELKMFYTDSGCWLMYDNDENVYCGGIDCALYKSSKKLDEVITIIFSKLLENSKELYIESFAPDVI